MEESKAGRIDEKLKRGILLFQFADFGSNRVELVLQLVLPTLSFPQISEYTHKRAEEGISWVSVFITKSEAWNLNNNYSLWPGMVVLKKLIKMFRCMGLGSYSSSPACSLSSGSILSRTWEYWTLALTQAARGAAAALARLAFCREQQQHHKSETIQL